MKSKYKSLDNKLHKLTQSQITKPQEQHTFYPRVINNTNIPFSNCEMNLLQKGLKYNLHAKKKNWIQTLALEAETAITQLPTNERDVYRKLVAERIDTPRKQNPTHKTHPESKVINSLQKKLKDNDATVTGADKGNTIVILRIQHYETKLQDFLSNNDFRTISTDPTTSFQTQILTTIRQSPTLIPNEHRWKYINMNPSAPSIKGLIKLHKQDQPIRPVMNWRNAPAYKLSRLFTDKINHLAPLPHSFNIKNTHELLRNLEDTPMLPHYNLASLDITNLYSNIPVLETRTVLANILKHELIDPQTQQELLQWFDVITRQNYFTHKKQTVIQQDGLAMGAPSSGLIAEIFLQHIEHTHLAYLTQKHNIVNYCRYVDDILIIFDPNHTTLEMILNDFNSLHPKLQFTAETENDHNLNYLDLSIHRTPTNIKTAIYRKPTFTDTIIPFTSNHPAHHKYATVKYLYNRLDTYNLQHEEYQQELLMIHNILHNNSFPIRPHKSHTRNPVNPITPRTTHKWASFTYVGKETTYITNIFKRSEPKIAFRTTHTLGNMLTHRNHPPVDFSSSGVYKLICPDCHKAYVGQTGRQFAIRYKEHKAAFFNNSNISTFAKHLSKKPIHLAP
jgi:hypothetical protein